MHFICVLLLFCWPFLEWSDCDPHWCFEWLQPSSRPQGQHSHANILRSCHKSTKNALLSMLNDPCKIDIIFISAESTIIISPLSILGWNHRQWDPESNCDSQTSKTTGIKMGKKSNRDTQKKDRSLIAPSSLFQQLKRGEIPVEQNLSENWVYGPPRSESLSSLPPRPAMKPPSPPGGQSTSSPPPSQPSPAPPPSQPHPPPGK